MYVHFQISREIFLNFSNFKCNLRIPIINMGIKNTNENFGISMELANSRISNENRKF